ncbi:phosphatase [Paraliobacillus quinghaiensis]|uniref:Phosphatase n=1 Tax=Paraliobacillus quinghaiensis TaxID=470815 RepID=A0A917TDQ8_9BACI|nr:HAD family hydrolase [Paraliobacillus quinghaiensis]GGM19408.1 phosphatase [Paraliobacillus quinghaiensis]
MTEYKALFLDIDGTILKPDHTIENSTREAIRQVKAKGLEIFLATGRPLHEVSHIAEELDIHSFIGYNGAFAIYQDREILNEAMKKETVEYYLKVCEQHDHEMVLYTSDKNLFTSLDKSYVKQFIANFDLKQNHLFTTDQAENILGITIMNLTEPEIPLYETNEPIFFSQVNVADFTHNYDVIRENVNKGRAIKIALDELGFEPSNAIAFGDGMNDKQMLEYVGESFAMGNAHQDLFAYAKHQTTTVEDNGIYNGLKKIGLID